MFVKLFYAGASLLALLAAVISISAQTKSKSKKDAPELAALVERMIAAQTKFDSAALEKIYAADYIEVSPVGEVDAREKAIGFYQSLPRADARMEIPIVTADEFSIRSDGKFAIVIARLTYAPPQNHSSARPPASLRATLACRKEKGVWKIASAQWTPIRPPRPPAAR